MDRLARALKQSIRIILHTSHLKRTGTIALLVGTWLTLFNQGDLILTGQWSLPLGIKIFLNYLTPFAVSNMGLLSRQNT